MSDAANALTAMWALPLIGVFLISFVPADNLRTIRLIAAWTTGCSFILAFALYCLYDRAAPGGGFQFRAAVEWFPHLNIAYVVAADGLNMPMILLAGILGFTAALVSFNIQTRVKEYYMLALTSIAGVFGVFECMDMFFLVLFYELASVPMYFLVGMWGSLKKGKGRIVSLQYAATKLILYLQLGGLLVLLSAIAVYAYSPTHTFDLTVLIHEALQGKTMPVSVQNWLFPLTFIAFGIEAGLWPFHTWLPDGHSSAPTALSMLLAGVLLKMGGYGIIRVGFQLMPDGAHTWMPIFAICGVINVIYGFLCALNQTDIKYLIAYSSVSHMGMVFLGLATFNAMGLGGAIMQMFSHGVITALLFAMAGYIYEKTHTRNIEEHGGLGLRMPFMTAAFGMAAMASLGLPGFSGFVAELMVFFGTWQYSPWLAVFASATLVYTATYLLRCVQKIFYGPMTNPHYENVTDAIGIEKVPLTILAIATVVVGFWPQVITDVMNPVVQTILK
ncbi:MAG: complex I subunit 4 family protein [Candidatus Xenobia bacterium]